MTLEDSAPHKLCKITGEKHSAGPALFLQFPLEQHLVVLLVLRVHIWVIRINEVLLMNDDAVRVDATLDFVNVAI